MRSLALAICLSLTCAPAFGAEKSEPCLRTATAADVFIDIKGDDLSVVVVNSDGKCSMIFLDMYENGPPRQGYMPWHVYLKVSDLKGNALSRAKFPGDYSGRVIFESFPPRWGRPVRLNGGQAHVMRAAVSQFLRVVSMWRGQDRKSDLPWGKTVVLEFAVLVHTLKSELPKDAETLSSEEIESLASNEVHEFFVESSRFLYRLPTKRSLY